MLYSLLLASAGIVTGGQAVAEPIGDHVVDLTPPIPRPEGKSCVVRLFDKREFQGEGPLPIAYRPPADCPGPWRKVVLEADFDVTAGNQFDRTADLTLGGATLFVGTTMEPEEHYAPHWHVERDVTDFAVLLRQPGTAMATLANYIDAEHSGHLSWGAQLVFYAGAAPAPKPIVLPITSGFARLDSQHPAVSRTLDLPRNMIRLEMDLFAIGQEREEFWYDCVPREFTGKNPFAPTPCAAPFREVEVRIDGRLAGLRAVVPVIFTGGINPALWRRAPGLHALNLPSARLDLTPFVGLLNDGQPHSISLGIPATGQFFRVSGTLIGEVDPAQAVVPGAVLANRLSPAQVATRRTRPGQRPDLSGTLLTTARRSGYAEGYIETSHGRVTTRVAYDLDARLTGVRDNGRSNRFYDARQSMTVTTQGGRPTSRRVDEHDTMAITIHVDPPRYGVKYGTQISQTAERRVSGDGDRDGTQTQGISTFAPSFSVLAKPQPTPNRMTATARVRDAAGRCHQTEAVVADDQVTRTESTACRKPTIPAR